MNLICKRKAVLLWLMGLTLLVFLFPGFLQKEVKAQETGLIKGNRVNLREGPAITEKVLCLLEDKTALKILASKTGADGKKWYQVLIEENGTQVKGYVIENYVNLGASSNPSDTTSETGKNTTEKANQKTQEATGEDAQKTETQKGKIIADNVNVRQTKEKGAVLCKLSKNVSVTVKQKQRGSDGLLWYEVSFKQDGKNQSGWVCSDFVKLHYGKTTVLDASTDVVEVFDSTKVPAVYANKGVVIADHVNVRNKSVSGTILGELNKNDTVEILSEKSASDNYIWYRVSYVKNDKTQKGYVRSDFVNRQITIKHPSLSAENKDEEVVSMTDEQFDAYLDTQAFPASYKEPLKALRKKHPTWIFKAVHTNLSFEDALLAESKVGLNLVSKSAIASWKSTEKAAYDYTKNVWYGFDGGSWVAASGAIIRYYMDPRNFLDETNVFQFETLEYEDYQNLEGIKKLLSSSFMKGDYIEPDGSVNSYADTFLKVAQLTKTNPYHLAARCYQEQGKGTSDSISGKVAGLENYFNYYNIGAYASGGNSPTRQGLIYASKSTEGATNYERPWNTRYKSILGGAEYVSKKYIEVGQNTLYFQKFNVVNTKNGLYKHQYMTNLQAAASEAVKMSKAYAGQESALVFLIPVYKDLPDQPCAKPTAKENPNNYIKTLTITEQELVPAFSPSVDVYTLNVKKSVKQIEIKALPVADTSVITGTGSFALDEGENTFRVICRSESGADKEYTIRVTRK